LAKWRPFGRRMFAGRARRTGGAQAAAAAHGRVVSHRSRAGAWPDLTYPLFVGGLRARSDPATDREGHTRLPAKKIGHGQSKRLAAGFRRRRDIHGLGGRVRIDGMGEGSRCAQLLAAVALCGTRLVAIEAWDPRHDNLVAIRLEGAIPPGRGWRGMGKRKAFKADRKRSLLSGIRFPVIPVPLSGLPCHPSFRVNTGLWNGRQTVRAGKDCFHSTRISNLVAN
jgi:hypothetical protein